MNLMQKHTYKVLTIAGSDPSGGAGVQADIKTIAALGGYAASAITALTVQNTLGVKSVYPIPADVVREQIKAVMEDIEPQAIKIGMVKDAAIVRCIAQAIKQYAPQFVVFDTVMVSTSGHNLIDDDVIGCIEKELIPHVSLITPNLHEAQVLLGRKIELFENMEIAAMELAARYQTCVLIKGGHMDGNMMCDVLSFPDGKIKHFSHKKIDSQNLHGTGCTLSSAIATFVSKSLVEGETSVTGQILESSISDAKKYVSQAILEGSRREIGKGNGPLWHNI